MKNNTEQMEILKRDYEILERKFAEKSFKFLAINQTTKTIAKEDSIPSLKKLILDMLFEVSLVKRGLCFEIKDRKLTFNGSKNCYTPYDKIGIDMTDRVEEVERLNGVNVIKISSLNEKNILPEIFKEFDEGFCLTFMAHNSDYETMFIVLGEKAFGSYSEVDEEFLITIRGQVEIILENAVKKAMIERKNAELLEKNFNLGLINTFSTKLSTTLEVKKLHEYIRELLEEKFNAKNIAIFNYDDENERFFYDRENEESIVINSISEPCKVHVLGGVIDKNEELVEKSTFYKEISAVFDRNKDGIPYIIPLVSNSNLLGIIAFKSAVDIDISLLETLRGQISVFLYNATLYTMAITDSMTKLYLQTYFKERLDQEIRKYERYNQEFSLLMLDIDHFKKFNDTYGHLAGDLVIKEVAKIIKDSVRKFDIVSRYGGEEFGVMLLATGPETALLVAERIRKNIEKRLFIYNEQELKVTISIGVAHISDCEELEYNAFINLADKALYTSKNNGRNKVTLHQNKEGKKEG